MHRADSMAPYQAAESLRLQSVMLGGPADPTAFLTSESRPDGAWSPGFQSPRGSNVGSGPPAWSPGYQTAPWQPGPLASPASRGSPQAPGPRQFSLPQTPRGPESGHSPPRGSPGTLGMVTPRNADMEYQASVARPLHGAQSLPAVPQSVQVSTPTDLAGDLRVARSQRSLTARFSRFLGRRNSSATPRHLSEEDAHGTEVTSEGRTLPKAASPLQRWETIFISSSPSPSLFLAPFLRVFFVPFPLLFSWGWGAGHEACEGVL